MLLVSKPLTINESIRHVTTGSLELTVRMRTKIEGMKAEIWWKGSSRFEDTSLRDWNNKSF